MIYYNLSAKPNQSFLIKSSKVEHWYWLYCL